MIDLTDGPLPQTRVGVVASFDFDRDRELWRWAPDDVTFHLSRTDPVPSREGLAMVTQLNDPAVLTRATREVLELGVETVAYLCTACSFVGGMEGERRLRGTLLGLGAPSAVTTSGAAVAALQHLGVRRVAVAHPYIESVGALLQRFLEEAGFSVVSLHGLGLQPLEIPHVRYGRVRELISQSDHVDAEAIFVSCTGLATYDVIAPMEEALGKPIVTANQVTAWSVLRGVSARAVGPGQSLLTQ